MEELAAGLVDAFVGVRAEEVALGLKKVGGKAGRAVAVVVGEGGAEGRRRHAALGGERNDLAPVRLRRLECLVEVGVEQEVHEVGVPGVGLGDLLEERGADDAAAPPDLRDLPEVELPAVFLLRLAHQLEALGVGAIFEQ